MDWQNTELLLANLKAEFIKLHDKSSKDWTDKDHTKAKILREACIDLGYYRYELVRQKKSPDLND